MAKFICLHKEDEPIYVNIDVIDTVNNDMSSDERVHGKPVVSFFGGFYIHTDESVEEIMRLIEEKENGNQH